ncbi:hypothetical protein AKJ09_03988 [Labilithrix luteola]|uniref:TolB protein n=1 Tax=Labilithrix luteola TaxID=1391654 RepID=A0A0K1PW08_9BACT|nr:hypothetical protein [Labilithrix luteola]AKU97324.1 hypothetical protein AKJ09_03988 [Labilithrix luteola]
MPASISRSGAFLLSMIVAGVVAAACGSDLEGEGKPGTRDSDEAGTSSGGPSTGFGDTDGSTNPSSKPLDVQPSGLQTIQAVLGQAPPTVAFTATMNDQPINVAWAVDRGEIASVDAGPSSSATVKATGTTGGLVTLSASLNGQVVKREVLVQVTGTQNGVNANIPAQDAQIAHNPAELTAGGGVGGVGGEGLGGAVTDPATATALGAPSSDGTAKHLTLLYPYDKTVFPRGMLAPLLQWRWDEGDADAIAIHLETTSKSFSWTGTFGRPAILGTTGKYIRSPIPQDVWAAATNSAGGTTSSGPDKLTMTLVVAKGGVAYGPIQETWTIAPGRLSGTIYYNSYGTKLAENQGDAVGGNKRFGGAVLSIRVGDTGPKLTAGTNGGDAQCRVCHSVSANGASLIAQLGNNSALSSHYAITPTSINETPTFNSAYPAIAPDGASALSSNAVLFALPGTTLVPTTGLTDFSNLGTPAFSPDGKAVVFNPMASSTLAKPTQKLVVMDYDATTHAFSGQRVVFDASALDAKVRPGWPAFLPDAKSIVFQRQSDPGLDGNGLGDLRTRKGAYAQIYWTSSADANSVTPLDNLNGKGYLPKLPAKTIMSCTGDTLPVGDYNADHALDVDQNYEPTVNPVATGGYAWVVFTSRRMYGNEATIPPFCSDPRGVDLVQNITTKKLWVAAIDLNAPPGTDASHPAFYLPAQELLAGNARGFWVLDPCRSDGESCSSGDQCCNGSCGAGEAGLVCGASPPNATCAGHTDKCTDTLPCCDSRDRCIGGFCTTPGPQ